MILMKYVAFIIFIRITNLIFKIKNKKNLQYVEHHLNEIVDISQSYNDI